MLRNIFFLSIFVYQYSLAAEINLAVASNFTSTAKKIVKIFEQRSKHKVNIISGSSGKLYAQIIYGAPYDIFLSADEQRADKLIKNGHAVEKESYIYAYGVLVLVGAKNKDDLDKEVSAIAIGNEKVSPYGIAAIEVLNKLGKAKNFKNKLRRGENISKVYQYLKTGNLQYGFMSLSQVKELEHLKYWVIPMDLYNPIIQKAVRLQRSIKKNHVSEFFKFLKSNEVKDIIRLYGHKTHLGYN